MTRPDTGSGAGPAGHVALVVTAAPLAHHTRRTYDALRAAGWRVTICPTSAASDWMGDAPKGDLLAGRIRPDAVICCPATFNTLNKWAAGINDSPALGVLNDALGLDTPVLAVPMVAERLCRHPVWPATLRFLADAGVETIDPLGGELTSRPRGIRSGTGDNIASAFDPELLVRWLRTSRRDSTG
jgi:phosphopantothenoylcysteine decarboxylase